jgi:hypothetical protein
MELSELERIHTEHWRPGWGSVTWDEMEFFQDLIVEHRPKSFIEVGTASGLSGGLISLLMDENDGERFVTVDHDNTFFGDTSKENGFLLPEIYPSGRVEVVRKPFTVAADVPELGWQFEMGFIDANHQHPWPLMDTLCVYPMLRGPKILFQHDLDLYRKQTKVYGIGPKYLYDQFPQSRRSRATANNGNLFAISMDIPAEEVEQIAIDAFYLPWTLRSPINPRLLEKVRKVFARHYSPRLLEAFDEATERFNHAI